MDMILFLLNILNWFGLVVFAISGALLAVKHRMDLIGYILLGTATAIGGGTFRDLILGLPVFWTIDTKQLFASVVISALAGIIAHYGQDKISHNHYQKTLEWFDALGLSVFAIAGTLIAQHSGAHFWVALVCGMMTATGGGLIRDIIANETPFITKSELYASAAAIGSLSVLLLQYILPVSFAILLSLMATFTLRIGAILWGWHPPFSPKD